MDEYVQRHAPGPVVALHPDVVDARDALRAAMAALHEVSDADLVFAWDWDGMEVDVRYGFYRLYELLEVAAAEAELAVGSAAWGAARAPIAAATAARWELHGLLAGLRDADLDADPGGGEWTVRQTLGHMLASQRSYIWATAWWIGMREAPAEGFPMRVPEDLWEQMPTEDEEATGTLAEIGEHLDELMDGGTARMAMLTTDELAAPARWSGLPLTAGFRLWRWSSHIREHTVQVEKTLVMLRRDPSEVDRLLRLIAAAYGRLEAKVFGIDPELIGGGGSASGSAAAVFDAFAAVLDRYRASIPSAALAKLPAPQD